MSVDLAAATEALVCDEPVPVAPPSDLSPEQGGRRTPPDPADVWLTTIGLVFDEGLNGLRSPRSAWQELAADALGTRLQLDPNVRSGLATLRFEEWADPSAADVVGTADAVGLLLDQVAEHGVAVFDALTEENKRALRHATQLMALVHEEVALALRSS